ncbi:MAG: FG-GAP-like repeat-containing protein [Planctomycetes bacterium]|nr:FG-GAP-like repeat-containing protein [Planctomycetota bacterium]
MRERGRFGLAATALALAAMGVTAAGCSDETKLFVSSQPRRLVFDALPGSVVAGEPITPGVTVRVVDEAGQTITSATDAVTIALQATNGAALTGARTVSAAGGIATFSDLRVDRAGDGLVLVATAPAAFPGASASFAVAAGAPHALRFVEPAGGGAPLVPLQPIQVEVLDALGNRVTSSAQQVSLALVAGNGAVLGGTTTRSAVEGVATFSDLTVDRGGTYQLTASAGALTGDTSGSFTIAVPGAPAAGALAFVAQPSDAARGAAIAPQVAVEVRDGAGNLDATATHTVTVMLGANPGGATLGGTLSRAAVAGVATFDDLRLDRAASGYRLIAFAGSLAPAQSDAFAVTGAPAARLQFTAHPGAAAGAQVQQQANGAAFDLAGLGPVGALLPGTVTVAVTVTGAGARTIRDDGQGSLVEPDALPGGGAVDYTTGALTGVTASLDDATPVTLDFQVAGASVGAGVALSARVAALTATGEVDAAYAGPVSVRLGVNLARGTLGGTLTVNAAGGVATFHDLVLDRGAPDYTLVASSGALEEGASRPFAIAPTAFALAEHTAPAPSPVDENAAFGLTIRVTDQGGAGVDGVPVTLAVDQNPTGGVLRGALTRTSANGGLATFDNLMLDRAGAGYTLRATAHGVPGVTTSALVVQSATPTATVWTVGTTADTPAGATLVDALVVEVRDGLGRPRAGVPVQVVLGQGPAGAVLSGTTVRTTAGAPAQATFNDLRFDTPGAYTLWALVGGLPPVESASFTITGAPASGRLVVTSAAQPPVAAGALLAPITVELRSLDGGLQTAATHPVTLVLGKNPGGGTLRGTLTVNAVAGVATFDAVRIFEKGGGYTLTALSGGYLSATTAPFNVQSAFSSVALATTHAQPTGLAVGDRDGDGSLDLVTTNDGAGTNSTLTDFRNDGAGSFTAASIALPDARATSVALMAPDAEGDVRIVVGHQTNRVRVLSADGTVLAPNTIAGQPILVVRVGELLGDAKPDYGFVSAPPNNSFISGNPAGPFASHGLGQIHGLAFGNVFNLGAGRDDVVVLRSGPNRLGVRPQTAPGVIDAETTFALPGAGTEALVWVELVDLDGDGDLDALVVLGAAGDLSLALGFNDGADGFDFTTDFGTGTPGIVAAGLAAPVLSDLPLLRPAAGDVTGNGFVDLVVPVFGADRLFVYQGTGPGTFNPVPEQLVTGAGPVQAVVADLTGNGLLEVAVTCRTAGEVTIFRR